MATVEKISIALSSELLETVKEAVASGRYASASEVIREALRDWNLRKPLREAEVERLRQAWIEGLQSGPSQPFDIEQIKKRARERLRLSRCVNAQAADNQDPGGGGRSHRYLVEHCRGQPSGGRSLPRQDRIPDPTTCELC